MVGQVRKNFDVSDEEVADKLIEDGRIFRSMDKIIENLLYELYNIKPTVTLEAQLTIFNYIDIFKAIAENLYQEVLKTEFEGCPQRESVPTHTTLSRVVEEEKEWLLED